MSPIPSILKVSLSQFSDRGPKPENQDTIGARIPEGGALTTKGITLTLADGVSSSASARQASQTAVSGFLSDYYATPDTWNTRHAASVVIQALNRFLWSQGQNSVREEGQLTTFTSLILKGESANIFHVGDSRVFRLRDGNIEQLTRDHVQRVDKNTQYLSRALGADMSLEVDLLVEPLRMDDIFVLTSDGVHDSLSPNTIAHIILTAKSFENIAELLVQAALDSGTSDNTSAQVVKIDALGPASRHDTLIALSQLPFPPLLEPGQSLDGYRVEKILHESERSQIYLVVDNKGQKRAMKTPSPNYLDDLAYIERFAMESWIGSRVQSAQVARIVTPESTPTCLYYVSEYIPGPTLGQVIRERAPLNLTDAVELIENIIKGLRAFHRKETLHQDIKPENIVVGRHGPVIIDFGSCSFEGAREWLRSFPADNVLGTLTYSAPEYRYGGEISTRSDQFSLGAVLYELVTGEHPYGPRYETANRLTQFQKLGYIPARRHNPLIPEWFDNALEKSLAISPKARYGALSEWLRDLQRPNPRWISPRERPFIDRHPLRFWKIFACIGWASVIATWLLLRH